MDLINNRTKEIGAMALDGLYERSKAISANTANALTPGYKRKEVTFEDSLRNIIQRENEKENLRLQNSIAVQNSLNNKGASNTNLAQSPAQIALQNLELNSEVNKGFRINVEADTTESFSPDGNNVSIESEMMDEAKTGMQYRVVSNLLSKSYAELRSIITGQPSS